MSEQPLLAASPPGRLEVIPLPLVGGTQVQDPPARLDRFVYEVRQSQYGLAKQGGCGGGGGVLPAAVPEQEASSGPDNPRENAQCLAATTPGVRGSNANDPVSRF